MSRSTVSLKEIGKSSITPPERRAFAKAFGLSLDQFDELWRGRQVHSTPGPTGIPIVNAAPAGGFVDMFGDQIAQAEYHDADDYLDRDADTRDPLLFAVRVVGPSMYPSIRPGDHLVFSPVLGVPRPAKHAVEGDVVFVRVGRDGPEHGVTIGRYHPISPEILEIRKDNPACPTLRIETRYLEQLAVCVQRRSTHV